MPIPIDLGPPSDQVILVLYGTGIRNRSDISGVAATIEGAPVNVLYAGPAPGFVGRASQLAARELLIGRAQ